MNKKVDAKQQFVRQSKGYSKEYESIRKEAESTWPEWKIQTYNLNFATSINAKKIRDK